MGRARGRRWRRRSGTRAPATARTAVHVRKFIPPLCSGDRRPGGRRLRGPWLGGLWLDQALAGGTGAVLTALSLDPVPLWRDRVLAGRPCRALGVALGWQAAGDLGKPPSEPAPPPPVWAHTRPTDTQRAWDGVIPDPPPCSPPGTRPARRREPLHPGALVLRVCTLLAGPGAPRGQPGTGRTLIKCLFGRTGRSALCLSGQVPGLGLCPRRLPSAPCSSWGAGGRRAQGLLGAPEAGEGVAGPCAGPRPRPEGWAAPTSREPRAESAFGALAGDTAFLLPPGGAGVAGGHRSRWAEPGGPPPSPEGGPGQVARWDLGHPAPHPPFRPSLSPRPLL